MAQHLTLLDQAIIDTITGHEGVRRLIVTMPPRHGKSELCSKYLPAWYLGAFPDHRVILSSYEAQFAGSWGGKARNILHEWGPRIFGVDVSSSPSGVTHWDIAGRAGGMQTAGVGGPITGKGANLLIIDDPCVAEGQVVTTMRGPVPIESVIVGDRVLTHRGRWKRVSAVHDRGIKPIVRAVIGGRILLATPDHLVYTRFGWTELKNAKQVYALEPRSDRAWRFVPGDVSEIEEFGTARVYDLSVEDDCSFVAAGVAVHNCKNAEEAASEAMRAKAWEWWQSTAYTRLEPDGAAIVIQTRWHQDDLAGKLLADMGQGGERWRVVNLPAIGDDGKALWPERFPLDKLREIQRTVGGYFWSAMYQQHPTPPEGGKFKREWFKVVPSLPAGARKATRYWDKAATEGGGDYSAGCLVVQHENLFYIADMARGQWSDLQRENMIQQCAEIDRHRFGHVTTWIEQEPGSGGKDSAAATIRRLAGHSIRADKVTGSKDVRAAPFAAQCEAGNVRLVAGPWNAAFLDELCMFPNGTFDDQVDSSAGGFNKLTMRRRIVVG